MSRPAAVPTAVLPPLLAVLVALVWLGVLVARPPIAGRPAGGAGDAAIAAGAAEAGRVRPPRAASRAPEVEVVTIFDQALIGFDTDVREGVPAAGPDAPPHERFVRLLTGQAIERTLELPEQPDDLALARRLVARVSWEPVVIRTRRGERPGDPWPRMGSINLVIGDPSRDYRSPDEPYADDDLRTYPDDHEIELVRFITGFGGRGSFETDLTALAPLLSGRRTIRAYVSTYANPAWRLTLELLWTPDGVGPRRPVFARRVFNAQAVEAEDPVLTARIDVPEGLATPRLRLLSTGHGGDEFAPRTHRLLVDGVEVARFRPWTESGGLLRDRNPTSGRVTVEGRSLWSSDLDRAGWHPGRPVEPMLIPLPELTPGRHEIRLIIDGIRPAEPAGEAGETVATGESAATPPGFWRVSGVVVADEPWPPGEQRPSP